MTSESVAMEGVLKGPQDFNFDHFEQHPFSYPYMISAFDSSSSSANESPITSQPPISSVSPPSRRSSRTSWETSWFDEGDDDMMGDVEPYGTEQDGGADHKHDHRQQQQHEYFDDHKAHYDDYKYDDSKPRYEDIKSPQQFEDIKPRFDEFKPPASPPMQCNDSVMQGDGSETGEISCQFDNSDWFAQFDGHLDISDAPPTRENLDAAGDVPVYDSAGGTRPFKSLFALGDVVGDRQLIVFIRHFYCGACRSYISALINTVNAQTYFTMPVPTSIVVIGCGNPDLIRQYKALTQCPFPIFADPTRRIFKHLGMRFSLNMLGSKRPEYMNGLGKMDWVNGQLKDMAKAGGKRRFNGGNYLQVGGEFLFQDGQVVWCHRMRNYRGHAEMDTIKRILDIDR